MSQLMLQAPGSQNAGTGTWQDIRFSGRAIEQNAIRYDGVEGSAIIDAAPGNLNGEIPTPFKLQASLENVQEFRVESSNYPAEYGTGTGGQVNVVTKSGTQQRPRLAVRIPAQRRVRCAELLRHDATSTAASLPKSPLKQNQFGGSVGGPIREGQSVLLRQLRRLPAGRRRQLRRSRAERRGVGARGPGDRARCGRASSRRGAVILPGASTNPDFDIAQLQGLQKVNENAFSGRLDYRVQQSTGRCYVRVFHDHGDNDQPEGVSGRVVADHRQPDERRVQPAGHAVGPARSTSSSSATTRRRRRINGIAPVINGIDFGNIVLNLSGSVANTGIAGQGCDSGIVVPGGLVRANSATNGRGAAVRPVLADVRRLAQHA